MNNLKRGFTMVEFIVYVGGLGLVSLLISTIIMATQNHLLETRRSLNIEELHGQILLSLTNPASCYNTFNGINRVAAGTNIPNIRSSANTVLYNTGGTFMQNISIVSMVANNYVANPAAGAPAPYTGTFDLTIVYRVPIGTGGATQDRPRIVTIRTELDPVGNPLVRNFPASTNRCTSGTSSGFGYDPNRYVQRDRMDNAAKQGDLTIEGRLDVLAWPGNPPGVPAQAGSIRAYGGLYVISDKRFKQEMRPLDIPLEKAFEDVQGKKFVWKQSGSSDYGFIAQDVEKILPELVTQRKEDGVKTVNYLAFIPIMHDSYKKLASEGEQIENRLRALEQKFEKNKK